MFQWIALWPLVGISLARNRVDEGIDHARSMLEPLMQRLPDRLAVTLEAAVKAADRKEWDTAEARLTEAAREAYTDCYL